MRKKEKEKRASVCGFGIAATTCTYTHAHIRNGTYAKREAHCQSMQACLVQFARTCPSRSERSFEPVGERPLFLDEMKRIHGASSRSRGIVHRPNPRCKFPESLLSPPSVPLSFVSTLRSSYLSFPSGRTDRDKSVPRTLLYHGHVEK